MTQKGRYISASHPPKEAERNSSVASMSKHILDTRQYLTSHAWVLLLAPACLAKEKDEGYCVHHARGSETHPC